MQFENDPSSFFYANENINWKTNYIMIIKGDKCVNLSSSSMTFHEYSFWQLKKKKEKKTYTIMQESVLCCRSNDDDEKNKNYKTSQGQTMFLWALFWKRKSSW